MGKGQLQHTIVNSFEGGMSAVVAAEIQNSNVYRRAMNMRLQNVGSDQYTESNDYTLSDCPGNIEAFTLSDNFYPIGWTEYNDILYIMSFNSGDNLVEFGSFPSPQASGGFAEVYKPFQNMTDVFYQEYLPDEDTSIDLISFQGLLGNLTIDNAHINYNSARQPDIVAREAADGSVNLYICRLDGSDIVINNGFNIHTGNGNGQYYNLDSFVANTHHVINEAPIATIEVSEVTTGGALESGVYHFFLRYITKDSPTTFYSKSNPIPVFRKGLRPGQISGGKDNFPVGAKIAINIYNIDVRQEYYQIGLVHYFGDQHKQVLLTKRYKIDQQTSALISITGTEDSEVVEEDLFVNTKSLMKQSGSHDVIADSLIQANLKNVDIDYQALQYYASTIEISEDHEIVQISGPEYYNPNATFYNTYVNEYGYKRVGYHSGETYMYKAHAVLKDGTVVDGFGMKGCDFSTGNRLNENTKGIFRFSESWVTPFYESTNNEIIRIKLPSFTFPEVQNQWIIDNVSGWMISRAERNKNKTYMGLAMNLCNGYADSLANDGLNPDPGNVYDLALTNGSFVDSDLSYKNKKNYFPLVNKNMYSLFIDSKGTDQVTAIGYGGLKQSYVEHERLTDAMAIQSPDISIDSYKGKLMLGTFVKAVAHTIRNESTIITNKSNCVDDRRSPSVFHCENYEYTNLGVPRQSKQLEIKQADDFGDGKYISKVEDGGPNQGMFYYEQTSDEQYITNLGMIAPAYIVAELQTKAVGTTFLRHNVAYPASNDSSIVTMYYNDPSKVVATEMYDANNTRLFQISNDVLPVILPGNDGNRVFVLGGGDCFTQRVWWKAVTGRSQLRQQTFDKMKFDAVGTLKQRNFPSRAKFFTDGYGYMVSAVLECNYNFNGKYEDGSNGFYPFTGNIKEPDVFANKMDAIESPFYNDAFSRTLHYRSHFCYNHFRINSDIFPVRVRYSSVQNQFAKEDNWRKFPAGQVKDYESKYGAITRVVVSDNRLYLVQRYSVFDVPINEKTAISDGASPIIIGSTQFMSPDANMVLKIGSQHWNSIIKGMIGFYGVSEIDEKIWIIAGGQGEMISLTRGIDPDLTKFLNEAKKNNGEITDGGIERPRLFAHYDKYNKEAMFWIHNKNVHKGISYSEKSAKFTSWWNYQPLFFMQLNNRMFSITPYNDNWPIFTNQVFEHDKGSRNTFFKESAAPEIEIYVKQYGTLIKEYHSHDIACIDGSPVMVEWKTPKQFYENNVAQMPFWFKPEQRDGHWYMPIPRQREYDNVLKHYVDLDVLNGQWLYFKVVLSGENFRVISISTTFTILNN